jgi:hypothetical protein
MLNKFLEFGRLRLVLTREAGFKIISGTDGKEKMQIRKSGRAFKI